MAPVQPMKMSAAHLFFWPPRKSQLRHNIHLSQGLLAAQRRILVGLPLGIRFRKFSRFLSNGQLKMWTGGCQVLHHASQSRHLNERPPPSRGRFGPKSAGDFLGFARERPPALCPVGPPSRKKPALGR